MNKFIKEILEDNEGGLSSSRLIVVSWGLGVLLVWIILSFIKQTILLIPESILVIVLTTMGIKVLQRVFGEQSK